MGRAIASGASPAPRVAPDSGGDDVRLPWLSVTCAQERTRAALMRYLRYLAPGLSHLGPEPLHLGLRAVPPTDIPEIPPWMPAPAERGDYRVAGQAELLVYRALDGRGLLRLDAARRSAEIWASADHSRGVDPIVGLVSVAVLELIARRGLFGLHTAAVARDGDGYLLAGPSGSGKTSLCLALIREGFRYLTDDFVLLTSSADAATRDDTDTATRNGADTATPDGAPTGHGAGRLRCLPFFHTFNLDPGWGERYPELAFVDALPPLPNGKRMFDPEQSYPGSRVAEVRPTYLLFPTIVAHAESSLRRISPRDALCRLLPQSRLSARPEVAQAHVRALAALVRNTEAFELHHGRDFLAAPADTLRRVLAPLRRAGVPSPRRGEGRVRGPFP